ncbi:MAG: hypothetical protein EA401_05595 [Planctomycetota bacterium]|nr:MAG: hypothetical protein EA401_05595 [Planctomycetota bacterium]
MQLLTAVRYREVHWGLLVMSLILTSIGIAFVFSACIDPSSASGWSREATMQTVWLGISLIACGMCLHVPPSAWYHLTLPIACMALALQMVVIVAGGTSLVPVINGRTSWIVLGPLRLQPDEFVKIATILAVARVAGDATANLRQWRWIIAVCLVWMVPTAPILSNNLGNALPLIPMLVGVLLLAGARLRVVAGLCAAGMVTLFLAVLALPQEGPRSYMYRRIQAWLNPEDYVLAEAFQTLRSIRSVGSGQWFGKGYGMGDQNLLGSVPEKHTDMIFSVVGEETGFVGSSLVILLFLTWALVGLWATMAARDRFARLFIGAFTCMIMGQVALNLAVVLGMMPVTGVTLPFFSYGGSSLLATYIGVGICLSCTTAKMHHFSKRSLE